jgi:hypothetical protein
LGRRVLIEPEEIRRLVDEGRDEPNYRHPRGSK